jgi:hypothetical protein
MWGPLRFGRFVQIAVSLAALLINPVDEDLSDGLTRSAAARVWSIFLRQGFSLRFGETWGGLKGE